MPSSVHPRPTRTKKEGSVKKPLRKVRTFIRKAQQKVAQHVLRQTQNIQHRLRGKSIFVIYRSGSST